MAYTVEFTFSTMADANSKLASIMSENGWSITTNTSTVVTGSKSGIYVTFTVSGAGWGIVATVSGQASPTVSIYNFIVGYRVRFTCAFNDILIGREYFYNITNYGFLWGGLFNITDKIGTWSGGTILIGSHASATAIYFGFFNTNTSTYGSLFYNGSWTSKGGASAGRPYGAWGQSSVAISPNYYNSAVFFVPTLVCLYNTDTSYFHPLGFVPSLFNAGAGDVYNYPDLLSIAGNSYLYMDGGIYVRLS